MAKRRRLTRGRGKWWMGCLLSFLLGATLTIGVYTFLTEKEPLPKGAFPQDVFLVDQTIQSQLYNLGVTKRDVLLQSSIRKEGTISWEESSLKVQLPRPLSLSTIEHNLTRNLSTLGREVSIKSSQAPQSLQVEVRVMGRLTHRLIFHAPKVAVLPIPPKPRVAIVIDDLGAENHISKELLHWNLPITFSILPFMAFSKSLAVDAHQRGKEVILHLPMEPHDYPKARPGEGVLLHDMDEQELLDQLSKDIEAVPYILGVSNHMGSRFMEDSENVRIVLSELKRRNLFFLDSRTTPQTLGFQTAKVLGLRSTERTVFLDNSLDENSIKQKIDELIQHALSTGKAIGIGHPHPSTVKSLKEAIPKIKEKGIEIVPLSSLME
jgi:polysaccharide deacetylase 2 family uncharacterized protein YibQ